MPSSPASSSSLGEESYCTAEEDHHSNAHGSSEASSTIPTSSSSDSVYATANQTPTASLDMNRATASMIPIAAQDQNSFEALRRIEASTEERRERASSNVTAAPRESSFSHREPKIDMVEYRISVRMPEKEEDAPDSADEPSHLWPPQSAPRVNDGRPTSLADTPQSNYPECREASDTSYTYRPTPIDLDSQQQSFLSSSLPINNNYPSVVSNRATNTHQGLASTEEDEMPYDPSGRFIMDPKAPVFVPRQGRRAAMRARNPLDWVYYGNPLSKQGQVPAAAPTNTPTIGPPPPKVQLFGSGHGMFFDPSTRMFTDDGTLRKSPYRVDGTLPSQPDPESDFLTKLHYPEPAEDQLHIQSKREYSKRMANFGKNGLIQTFRVGGPMPQGTQQGTRVMVRKEGRMLLGRRRVDTEDDEVDGEGSVQDGPVYITDEMEANLKRLMGMTEE